MSSSYHFTAADDAMLRRWPRYRARTPEADETRNQIKAHFAERGVSKGVLYGRLDKLGFMQQTHSPKMTPKRPSKYQFSAEDDALLLTWPKPFSHDLKDIERRRMIAADFKERGYPESAIYGRLHHLGFKSGRKVNMQSEQPNELLDSEAIFGLLEELSERFAAYRRETDERFAALTAAVESLLDAPKPEPAPVPAEPTLQDRIARVRERIVS